MFACFARVKAFSRASSALSAALRPANAPPDQKLPTVPKMMPLQGERSGFYFYYICGYKFIHFAVSESGTQKLVNPRCTSHKKLSE